MKKLFGLGKGLESLIPTQNAPATDDEIGAGKISKENIFNVETSKIRPNEDQPRRAKDDKSLSELAASIKKHGVLQPLLVSKIESETKRGINIEYEIIAGERRWRAAKLARVPHVPVIIKNNLDDDKAKLEVALVENLQRKDLNALEEAEAYTRLVKEFGMSQRAIAERVGKSREFVANTMRLMYLPDNIKEALRSGRIVRTQARAILSFKDGDKQQEMFRNFLSGKVAVREVEQRAREHREGREGPSLQLVKQRFSDLEKNLAETLCAQVAIKNATKGGKIEIRFATLEELNKIAKVILG